MTTRTLAAHTTPAPGSTPHNPIQLSALTPTQLEMDGPPIYATIPVAGSAEGTWPIFAITAHRDDDGSPPWERGDGHGPVTDWIPDEDKQIGWVTLATDRDGLSRFYQWDAAVFQALKDGWYGCKTTAEAGEAVRKDYEFLKAWCDDEWWYIGLTVAWWTPAGTHYPASLFGVESNAGDYLTEVVRELAEQVLHEMRENVAKICPCCSGRGIVLKDTPEMAQAQATPKPMKEPHWRTDKDRIHHYHTQADWRVSLHTRQPLLYVLYELLNDGTAVYRGQATTLREAKQEVERRIALRTFLAMPGGLQKSRTET